MNIGFVGLGKLGLPCALAVESRGHNVVGYDPSQQVKDIIDTRKLQFALRVRKEENKFALHTNAQHNESICREFDWKFYTTSPTASLGI